MTLNVFLGIVNIHYLNNSEGGKKKMHIWYHHNLTHQDPVHKISAVWMIYCSVLVVKKNWFPQKRPNPCSALWNITLVNVLINAHKGRDSMLIFLFIVALGGGECPYCSTSEQGLARIQREHVFQRPGIDTGWQVFDWCHVIVVTPQYSDLSVV